MTSISLPSAQEAESSIQEAAEEDGEQRKETQAERKQREFVQSFRAREEPLPEDIEIVAEELPLVPVSNRASEES